MLTKDQKEKLNRIKAMEPTTPRLKLHFLHEFGIISDYRYNKALFFLTIMSSKYGFDKAIDRVCEIIKEAKNASI